MVSSLLASSLVVFFRTPRTNRNSVLSPHGTVGFFGWKSQIQVKPRSLRRLAHVAFKPHQHVMSAWHCTRALLLLCTFTLIYFIEIDYKRTLNKFLMPRKDPKERREWQRKYDEKRRESRRVWQKKYDKQRNAPGQPREIKRSQARMQKKEYDQEWYEKNREKVLLMSQQYYHDKHNPLIASLVKSEVNWFVPN